MLSISGSRLQRSVVHLVDRLVRCLQAYRPVMLQRCHSLNNLSSLSALIAALSSMMIQRLTLTWAHVSRGAHFERLARITDPSNNFAAYRNFYANVTTSCVPYIGELMAIL